jgi:enterochelin esterase family protein
MIADARIPPVAAVFVDPRTDIRDARTSKRMTDYALSDAYVRFLVEELHPHLVGRYRLDSPAEQTAIMGASLGGLIATYAAFKHPDVFGLCAAQSPAYWWANDSLIHAIAAVPRKNIKFYIDTGTIRDAREKALLMKETLEARGYPVHYEEHPEGHNWANWRARISHILEYFWTSRGR